MNSTEIKKLLNVVGNEFIKNYIPPKNRSKMTKEEILIDEIDFFSIQSFKLGLRLGAEVFSERKSTQ